jgi:hypothetical protein
MKPRLILITTLILALVAYTIFLLNEDFLIQKVSPWFPQSEENSPGYYADLVTFVFYESIGLTILLIATIYFSLYGNFLQTINRIETKLLQNSRLTLALAALVFFIVTTVIATAGLEQFPNSADEFAYLFQAEQLSEGKLWDSVHPLPDFFEFHHLSQKDGKWIGRFPPGWPAVLSLAYILHVPPFLINTFLGVVCVFVMFSVAKRFYDEKIAMWATITIVFSSFFIFNSATFFSHIITLLEGLLFVYFCHRFIQARRLTDALVAGVFLGMLVMTRQLTALIFFVSLGVYFLYKIRLQAFLPLAMMGIGMLPFVGCFLWYNYKITGDALVPVTMWTNADEALGFVKGHTPAQGLKFTMKRLILFVYWASPSLLILYFMYVLRRLKGYRKLLIHPEDYLFLFLIIGYFFYYHSGGNQYGPRFYLEGLPFLVIFVVAKTLRTNLRWAKVFLFLGLIYNVVKIPFIAHREHQVIAERKDVYDKVRESGITNAIVFISSPTGVMRPMPVEDLNRNDRYYRNQVLYARDLGARNKELMNYNKGKDFYIYRRPFDKVSGELLKIDSESDVDELTNRTSP